MGPGFRRDDGGECGDAARRTNAAAISFRNHKEFLFETVAKNLP
jgi:hypothetical protein